MATYVSNRNSGGLTDEKGHLKFWSRTITGHVLSGQQVVPNSTLNMNVRITEGDIRIPYSDYAHMAWSEGYTTITVATSDPTNPRIDRVVAYIDRSMTFVDTDVNNPGALKYKTVTGTPNSSPVKVSDSAVDTSVSGNPWVELATIRVNATVTQITANDITDTRTMASIAPEVSTTPVGTIFDFAGSAAPSGYLLCYGQAVSRTTYKGLFNVIGTTFGTGDGSTTFNLPDLRGRTVSGKDNMGGTSANRLTGITNGIDGDILGQIGGSEGVTLLQANIPSYNLTVNDPGHAHGVYDPGHSHGTSDRWWKDAGGGGTYNMTAGGNRYAQGLSYVNVYASGTNIGIYGNTTGISVNSGGSGTPHNNVQPTMILNKIIKT